MSEQCDLSGCTQPKRKEQDGTVHDYCCRDHAIKDIPNRDGKTFHIEINNSFSSHLLQLECSLPEEM